MSKTVPVILNNPEVIKNPKAEGERVGKLLRKYTTPLTEYRAEAEQRLLKLVATLMETKLSVGGASGKEMFRLQKLFWKSVEENYKIGAETSIEETSEKTVEKTFLKTGKEVGKE
jgi:hypothetical protein